MDGGANIYAYVEGNPLSSVDPDGLQISRIIGRLPVPVPPNSVGPVSEQNFNQVVLDGDYSCSRNRLSAEDSRARNMPFSMAGNGGVGNSSGLGTNTPYKHCREDPKDPNSIICKDLNGKRLRRKSRLIGINGKRIVRSVF